MRLSLYLFCLTLAGAAAQGARVQPSPADPARKAVSIIDEHYLYAKSNSAWKEARRVLRAGHYATVAQAYEAIGRQLAALDDPDLRLLTPEEYSRIQETLEAKRTGFGLAEFAMDRDPATGEARVVTALGDSPAARAGISPRDVIVSIDRRPTRSMTSQQIMDALAAPPGSRVRLAIRRENRIRVVELTASAVGFNPVQFTRREFRGKTIGYIRVVLFTSNAGQKVQEAVNELERQGATGFVLDLRNDPGGIVGSARDAAGAFVSGVLGKQVPSQGSATVVQTTGAPLTNKPLVILIDGGTANAAEFLAAALRDLHRAVLVGSQTYGRGQAQTYYPLTGGYGIFVPTAQLQTSTGRTFIPSGINPDVAVPGDFVPNWAVATTRDAQFLRAIGVLLAS